MSCMSTASPFWDRGTLGQGNQHSHAEATALCCAMSNELSYLDPSDLVCFWQLWSFGKPTVLVCLICRGGHSFLPRCFHALRFLLVLNVHLFDESINKWIIRTGQVNLGAFYSETQYIYISAHAVSFTWSSLSLNCTWPKSFPSMKSPC